MLSVSQDQAAEAFRHTIYDKENPYQVAVIFVVIRIIR